jgi:hypothetical protein
MYFDHFDFIGFVIPLLVLHHLHMLSKSFGYIFVQKNQFSVNLVDHTFAIREFVLEI